MATPNDPRKPLRSDLQKVFKDQRTLRAVERLFELVPGDLIALETSVDALNIDAAEAGSKATMALTLIEAITELVELTLMAPVPVPEEPIDNLTPPTVTEEEKDSLDPPSIPIYGDSGSFTTVDGKTVTVENGIITSIV